MNEKDGRGPVDVIGAMLPIETPNAEPVVATDLLASTPNDIVVSDAGNPPVVGFGSADVSELPPKPKPKLGAGATVAFPAAATGSPNDGNDTGVDAFWTGLGAVDAAPGTGNFKPAPNVGKPPVPNPAMFCPNANPLPPKPKDGVLVGTSVGKRETPPKPLEGPAGAFDKFEPDLLVLAFTMRLDATSASEACLNTPG